jgi:hypothetical protein
MFFMLLTRHVGHVELSAHNLLQAARSRGLLEFTHISKAGGTSMCRAAEYNGCANPGFDVEQNCMVKAFNDDPKWTFAQQVKVSSRSEPFDVSPHAGCAQWCCS